MSAHDKMGPGGSPSVDSMELIYIRCASCGKWMGVKRGVVAGVSHGICKDCFRREMKKAENDKGVPRP